MNRRSKPTQRHAHAIEAIPGATPYGARPTPDDGAHAPEVGRCVYCGERRYRRRFLVWRRVYHGQCWEALGMSPLSQDEHGEWHYREDPVPPKNTHRFPDRAYGRPVPPS